MKRFYIILICFLVVIIAAVIIINFYLTHKTRYLNYGYEQYAGQTIHYIGLGEGIKLKGYPDKTYPDQTIITDKRIIQKVIDYLNNIPFVSSAKDALPPHNNIRKEAILEFYNENDIVIGWVSFYGEEYIIRSLDGKVFKARDEGTFIISGLEELDLD